MKLFYVVLIIFFLSHCSFDSKSGIWNNEKTSDIKKEKYLRILKVFLLLENSLTKK